MRKNLIKISNRVSPILKQYGVVCADVFGSQARGGSRKNSDVDMVVTLEKPLGLFKFGELNDALENSLRLKVDLLTHKSINRRLKPYIFKDLIRIYGA